MTKIDLTQKICYVLNIITKVIMFASFIVSALLLVFLLITFVINTANIFGLMDMPEDLIEQQAYIAVAIINILAAGIFSKYLSKYFKRELADGTPFVQESAVMLRSVGIKGVILHLISGVLSVIVLLIFRFVANLTNYTLDFNFEGTGTLGLSITFIALSIILEAGCEEIKKIKE